MLSNQNVKSCFFVRFYFNHSCEYTKTEKKQRRSLERWTDVILRCKNLLENDISSVLCSKTCNYPCSNKKWKNVKAVPVYRARIITTHNNERLTIDFPIACKCVSAIKKTKKCRNNFLK